MESRFAAYTPLDKPAFWTEDHQPRYVTPLNREGCPRAFYVRNLLEPPTTRHYAVALFNHPKTNGLNEPTHWGFFVDKIGLIPKDELIYEGETPVPDQKAADTTLHEE